MPGLTEEQALAKLRDPSPISFEDLDDIFRAFGFDWQFDAPNTTWYSHPKYKCGHFPANPQHDFSVISEEQRGIVLQMLRVLIDRRDLEAS